jgi:hypothetical protein
MNHNHIDWNDIELVSSFTVTTKVKFAQLIYFKTGEPMDKAGSYGNLGIGGQIIERMERGAFAVVILLMHRLSMESARAPLNLITSGKTRSITLRNVSIYCMTMYTFFVYLLLFVM